MEGSDLLAAIAAAPDDDAPRLVYADWLSQRGDPRGEFITLDVLRSRADADDVVLPERARIEERIATLIAHHSDAWVTPLRSVAFASYYPRRGLFEHVECGHLNAPFDLIADRLREAGAPLRSATLRGSSAIEPLLMTSRSGCFDRVELLEQPHVRWTELHRLSESMPDLRSLDVDRPDSLAGGWQHYATLPLPLEHLGITVDSRSSRYSGVSLAQALAETPQHGLLRSLRLDGFDMVNTTLALPALESLELVKANIDPTRFGSLSSLTSLAIYDDVLTAQALELLLAAFPKLRRLTLRNLRLFDDAIEVLARAPCREHLRRLDLSYTLLVAKELRALIEIDFPALAYLTIPAKREGHMHAALRARFQAIELQLV